MSKYFIERPIFAFVISIFIVIAGLAAIRVLPVAQYPEIAPPTVSVVAIYPGASAEVTARTVATPLENAINGVENMLYISSTSTSNGVTTITVTFDIGTDIDQAALNVNNRVKQVEVRLPQEVRRQGVTVEKGSSSFLQVLAFYSPDQRYDDLYTSNYVTLNVLDHLKRIPGTTNVQIFGAKDYAMRIWIKPDKLSQKGLTIGDVAAALKEQNTQFAAGKIGQSPIQKDQELVYSITTQGRLSSVEEFENIIIHANQDGSSLRLKDVARVELGSKDYDFIGRINGKPATLVGVFLQPGANALSVAEEVQSTIKNLAQQFPQGLTYATVFLPDGASLQRTDAVVSKVLDIIKSNPNNEDVVAFTGFDFLGGGYKNSAATIFVTQKHWDERQVNSKTLVAEVFMKTAMIKDALILAFNPPAIFGLGNTGGFEFYIQNKGEGGAAALAGAMQGFQYQAQQDPRLGMVNSLWRSSTPQLYIDVDRERAKSLGVSLNEAFNTLAAGLGSYYVNDFNKFGRSWQVLLSSDSQYRRTPADVESMFVRNKYGEMVQLSAFARVEYSSGPDTVDRFNNLPAVKVMGEAAPGVSSGQALQAIEEIASKSLSKDFTFDWSSSSYQEKKASGNSTLSLVLAAVMVFLILAALYNRWTLPLSVLLALPFGIFGALIAIWLRGFSNDVYFQIGLVTLLGLAAKNAILIVEYALIKREQGESLIDAAMQAARLRFRPIIMTSLAFILGVLPLAISVGAGAGARQSVGTGVTGGMLAATFLAIFLIPFFFKLMMRESNNKAKTPESNSE